MEREEKRRILLTIVVDTSDRCSGEEERRDRLLPPFLAVSPYAWYPCLLGAAESF
jgi:hypothetical protein